MPTNKKIEEDKVAVEEQIAKCKEENVKGVFGYSTIIEDLAKKIGQPEKVADYIIAQYGTMKNFEALYRQGKVDEKDRKLAKSILRDVIDVDLSTESDAYDKLLMDILMDEKDTLKFYSSEKIAEIMKQYLNTKNREIIETLYGLLPGQTPKTQKKCGELYGLTPAKIATIKARSLKRLRCYHYNRMIIKLDKSKWLTEEENEKMSELPGKLSERGYLFKNTPNMTKDNVDIDILKEMDFIKNKKEIEMNRENAELERQQKIEEERMRPIREEEEKKRKEEQIRINENKKLNINECGFSTRICNALKKAGIETIGELANKTEIELRTNKIAGIGKKGIDEIINKLAMMRFNIKIRNIHTIFSTIIR